MSRFKLSSVLLAAAVCAALFIGLVAVGAAEEPAAPSILVTDVGQGNNAKIIRLLLKKNGVADVKFVEIATPDDLEGIEMMIVGVGASTKGLGAAGLDLDQEKERASKLLAAATDKSIEIVGVHIGGQPRRGEVSDTLNELVMMESDTFVVWTEGNQDGFFDRIAETRKGDNPDMLHSVESKKDVGLELTEIIDSSS